MKILKWTFIYTNLKNKFFIFYDNGVIYVILLCRLIGVGGDIFPTITSRKKKFFEGGKISPGERSEIGCVNGGEHGKAGGSLNWDKHDATGIGLGIDGRKVGGGGTFLSSKSNGEENAGECGGFDGKPGKIGTVFGIGEYEGGEYSGYDEIDGGGFSALT